MSAEHTQTTYSKEERSRMNRSRHLSDHELLFNGADYDGDVLKPTKHQINEIRREHDEQQVVVEYVPTSDDIAVRQVGHGAVEVVMRHDPDVERVHRDASKTIEQLGSEKENLENLLERTHELLEPYDAGLYDDKIPTDKKLRSLVTDRPIKMDPWFDDIAVGNTDATFRTTLSYRPGKDENTLDQVSIRIKRRGDKEPPKKLPSGVEDEEPMLDLHYASQGRLSSLNLKQINLNNATFATVIGHASNQHNPVGEFAGATLRNAVGAGGYNIRIETAADTPKIVIGYTNPYKTYSPVCEYRYEADKDKFIKYSANNNSGVQEISTEEYLGIIEGMLRLVPDTKVTI